MARQRLLNRDFLVLIAIGFCFTATYLLVLLSSTGYSAHAFGTSPSVSSLAACTFLIGALGARIYLGPRIDSIGRRRCLAVSGLLGGIVCLFYPLCTDLAQYCVVRVLHGVFYGLGLLCANSLVASVIPAARRAEGLGVFMLAFTLASAIAPYFSMYMEYGGDYTGIFRAAAVCCFIPLVLSLLLRSGQPVVRSDDMPVVRQRHFEPAAFRISAVMLVFGISYSSLLTFTTVYGEDIHQEGAMMNFFLVEAIATLISRTLLSRVPDRYGDNSVLIPCFVLYTMSLFIFAWVHTPASVYLCGAAMGFIIAYMQAVGQSIAIRRVEPERYSSCISTFLNSYDIALAIGPVILGAIADSFGYSDMYVAAGIVSAASFVLYIVLHGATDYRQGRRIP
ncbi:MAG: MFS transporter [archaeon]|nr:MFS transporter [archaeon]